MNLAPGDFEGGRGEGGRDGGEPSTESEDNRAAALIY
jgi:hypothetical protein